MTGADFGEIPNITPIVEQLISRGEISIINPGYGPEQNKLSMPIAAAYIQTDSGDPAILVSNCWYTEKTLQIFGTNGEYLGNFFNSNFDQASAITTDSDAVYITDDATGTIVKISRDLHTPQWIVNQEDQRLHTRRIGSLAVDDNYLVAFDTAKSKIRIYDKFTGEEMNSIGEFLPMTFEEAGHESLKPDGKVAFNGHHDIAIFGDSIVAVKSGVEWGEKFHIPASIKVISFDGKLLSERKISTQVGEIHSIAVDNSRRQIFLGVDNTVQIINEKGLIGNIEVPGCPKKGGGVLNLHIDSDSGNLIICHGGMNVPEKYVTTKGTQTVIGDRERSSATSYSQIITLSPIARDKLMKKTLGSNEFEIAGLLN
ncbi:MAG TPA: hypothetical protein VMR81_04305 [Patescibacteria group bacterium]|nr:hypothetical protein [Patescibacteria group bacterium]